MKDRLDNDLQKGDLVAYGFRSGNTGGICLAIVTNPEKRAIYSGGSQQGYGVSGEKLIRLGNQLEVNACPYNSKLKEQYKILIENAEKWL